MLRPHLSPDRPLFDFIVLDLDGTLVDSLRDLCDSANALVAEYGGRPLDADEIARMVGEGASVLVDRIVSASGIAVEPAIALARYLAIYDGRLLRHTRPYPGSPEFVRKASRDVPLAVLTNKPAAAARPVLEGLGLAQYFREIAGGDGPLPRKPDPALLFRMMGAANGSPDRTLLVGDSAIDLRTARNAGTRFCYARYGFGRIRFPEHEIGPCDWVVDSAHELLAVCRGTRPPGMGRGFVSRPQG